MWQKGQREFRGSTDTHLTWCRWIPTFQRISLEIVSFISLRSLPQGLRVLISLLISNNFVASHAMPICFSTSGLSRPSSTLFAKYPEILVAVITPLWKESFKNGFYRRWWCTPCTFNSGLTLDPTPQNSGRCLSVLSCLLDVYLFINMCWFFS